MDASPRPRPDEKFYGARLPAGFAALRLRIPRITVLALYSPESAPRPPPDGPELLCRLFNAAPDSYSQFRVFVAAAGGGLIVGGISLELVHGAAWYQPPAVRGDVEEAFKDAATLARCARWCARQLGLRAGAATIDGDHCVVISRSTAARSGIDPSAT